MAERIVGRVSALWRYPVKSMGAEPLDAVDISWHGLAGDRRWGFVCDDRVRSGFPWLTLRDRSDLAHYRPVFLDPLAPDGSPVAVRTPSGDTLDILDPALAADLGGGVRPMKQDRGSFDTAPLSLLTTRTVAGIGALVGAPLDVLRFRPNLLVEPAGDDPFPEDGWVGAVLRIGALRMRVDKRDQRCVIVTIDPDTAARNPAILRAIARERASCAGVYGATVTPGRVAVGDEVILEAEAAGPPTANG